jgi:hypothetical protein
MAQQLWHERERGKVAKRRRSDLKENSCVQESRIQEETTRKQQREREEEKQRAQACMQRLSTARLFHGPSQEEREQVQQEGRRWWLGLPSSM